MPNESVTSASHSLRSVRESATANQAVKMEKFIAKPSAFSGESKSGIHPKTWLKQVERIKRGLDFSGEETLLVATSYLHGSAGLWWESVEDSVNTWSDFVDAFTNQFANNDKIDEWWEELENLRQHGNMSVDQVKFRCVELFGVLGITSGSNRVRHFLRALKPSLAQRVAELCHNTNDWEEITSLAKRVESSYKKYGFEPSVVVRDVAPPGQATTSLNAGQEVPVIEANVVPRNDASDDVSVASFNSLSTVMKELCEGVRDLRLSVNTHFNASPEHGNTPTRQYPREGYYRNDGPRCFTCGQVGHISRYCTMPRNNQGESWRRNGEGVVIRPSREDSERNQAGPSRNSQGKGQGHQ